MLILSAADVRALVPMAEAIRLMGVAFGELSAGRAASPLRTPIHDETRDSDTLFMPAAVPAIGGLGLKVVSVYPGNAAKGLPTILALVALLDADTGRPLALLDGTYLTALRTGAVSGKATELLARSDVETLLCIGAGAQAFTQVWAVCTARPSIRRILIRSRRPESAERLVARLREELPELGARAEVAPDLGAAVRSAQVICAATSSAAPVFDDADVQPGTHINAIGAYTPAMQELPAATVARARVVVDAVEAALAEAGDLIAALQQGLADRAHLETELGQVVSGGKPGRTGDDQVTLFKSVGNAVQDIAVARSAFRPYLFVLGAACCWGMIGIVYALVQRRLAIEPVTIILIRAASGFALLGGFALLARRDLLRVRARDLPFLALFGVVSITGFYVALIYAYQLTSVPLATVLLYLGPAFVTAASALFLGEPLTRRKGLALALCLLGAALVVEPWRPEALRANWLGILLGLLSAVGYGLYSILGKLALRRVPPLTMVLYVLGFGTLGMLPVQLAAGSPLPGGLTLLALGLLMGIVITLLPLGLYTAGLNELPAGVASITATFEPVVAVALSALILGQVLRLPQLAGAALIIGGVVVLAGGERARREAEAGMASPAEAT